MPDTQSPLHIESRGDPRAATLVMLHGGGVGGWMWDPFARHLTFPYRLLIPDLPGHDHSAGMPYRSHDETLTLLVEHIEANVVEPVTVIGFSLGAQLAVLLAARHPHLIQNAVIISAQAQPTALRGATLAMLRMAAPLAKSAGFARLQAKELFVPDALLDDYLRTSRGITAQTLVASVGENIAFTIPDGWADFPGRSLILAGKEERRIMTASARHLTAALPGSELEIVSGCGHGIPLQEPEWLARRIEGWLG